METLKALKIKPKRYLEQKIRYCGGYTIKAILSAYNKEDNNKVYKSNNHINNNIHPSDLKRLPDYYFLFTNLLKVVSRYIRLTKQHFDNTQLNKASEIKQ